MRTTIFAAAICGTLFIAGCADKEKEAQLQTQLEKNQTDRTSLQLALDDRNQFVEEILKSVNEIYVDLEKARSKEGKLIPAGSAAEETPWVSSPDARVRVLKNIEEIGTALSDSRKKIGDLQSRIRKYRGEVANLNALLENLKTSLQEREAAIAQLKGQVEGLEQTVAEKTRLVGEKELVIEEQKRELGKVFYVAGTRKELEEKGIITDEGGFLWGLLGSTTTIASGVNDAEFTPLDRNEMQTIHVQGKIDEILPHRKPDFYATAESEEGTTEIKVLKPTKFWQGNHLVVVLD
jgi:outer membrane murein-binding lipoprotein Lpp